MALEIYKPGQGERVRSGVAVLAGSLLAYGCYALYNYLCEWPTLAKNLTEAFGDDVPMSLAAVIAAGVLIGGGFGIFLLSNYGKVADFLIDTEAELQKVTWSTRGEVYTHSLVVIATTVLLGVYIFVLDQILAKVFLDVIWG